MSKAKRSYRQFCGLAKALDVVGERWTLLVVRELLLGSRRYGALLAGLPGITTNLLATRLKEMEAAGLIEKHQLPAPASVRAYRLTEKGRTLEPVVMALGAFGFRHYMNRPGARDALDLGWAMVALRRRYLGSGENSTLALDVGRRTFEVRMKGEQVEIEECPSTSDVRAVGDDGAFRALFFGTSRAADLAKSRKIRVEGDLRTWRAFLVAFAFN